MATKWKKAVVVFNNYLYIYMYILHNQTGCSQF
jgi:hypothetical protein